MIIIAFISTVIISFLAGTVFMDDLTYSKKEIKDRRTIEFELPKKRVAGKTITYPACKKEK